LTAAALVADLQTRGVTLESRGDKLRVRPVSRLSPDELESLRAHKAEVLAVLRADRHAQAVTLDPVTVRQALGSDPDAHALGRLKLDVLAGVRALEREIASGMINPGVCLVHGRPLGDFLPLEEVARILRGIKGRMRGKREDSW
jgi:hypothetical protein